MRNLNEDNNTGAFVVSFASTPAYEGVRPD